MSAFVGPKKREENPRAELPILYLFGQSLFRPGRANVRLLPDRPDNKPLRRDCPFVSWGSANSISIELLTGRNNPI